jgi:hypothetical protein
MVLAVETNTLQLRETMEPEAWYLILCNDVQVDPHNALRLNILGLITHIRSRTKPPFPHIRPLLRVLSVLTRCQGIGELSLRIVEEGTGRVVFRNPPRRVRFAGSLQEAVGVVFAVRNCSFPAAGLYWVELIYSGTVVARQGLTLTG